MMNEIMNGVNTNGSINSKHNEKKSYTHAINNRKKQSSLLHQRDVIPEDVMEEERAEEEADSLSGESSSSSSSVASLAMKGEGENNPNWLNTLKGLLPTKWSHYVHALRPWSLSISFTPVSLGAALAYKTYDHFDLCVFFTTILTVISVHAAGNLVNTYVDFFKGVDSKRRSDDRTLVDSLLTPDEVSNLGAFFYILGCVGFILMCYLSPARMQLLALVYFGGLSSSFLYTGGIGLKYIALGDLLIMFTFGPLSVLFSFLAQSGSIDLVTLTYAIPLALNTEAILHSNNTRDMESDRKAGAVTLAILIGPSASHVLFALLLFIPYILFTVTSFHYTYWLLLPLITLPKAFQLEKQFRTGMLANMPKKMADLNFYVGLFFLVSILASNPSRLPALSRPMPIN